MAKEVIHTDKAPAAVGPYIQAAKTGGMVYCSGQLGLIPETGVLPEGVEAQAHQAMKNMGNKFGEEINDDLFEIIMQMVHKDPDQRPSLKEIMEMPLFANFDKE